MSIEIKMHALSPTMEEGTLAKWLVKEGDTVKSGDIMAEIETDKATMEFEAVDEGVIAKILVSEGTDNVKVGTVIAILAEEGEDASSVQAPTKSETPAPAKPMPTDPTDPNKTGSEAKPAERTLTQAEDHGKPVDSGKQGGSSAGNGRAIASPLARRVASQKGLDLSALTGSGPNGRIVKADVENAQPGQAKAVPAATASSSETASAPVAAPKPAQVPDIPHEASKLSNMRKTIARRLTESKQQVPHIYLTVDVRLDALLKLRQVCCDPRLVKGTTKTAHAMERAKLELLADLLPALVDEGRRVLVFSQFTEMLGLAAEMLDTLALPYLTLTGQTPPRQRGAVVRQFQAQDATSAPILLVSLKAGGLGLNLTAADTVIHLDPWWNPAVEEQATARAHRIGQDQPVFVYKLVVEGSIEERMLELQARKGALAQGVLGHDAEGAVKFSEADLHALLAPLTEPANNPLGIPGEDAPRWGGTGKRRPRPLQPPET